MHGSFIHRNLEDEYFKKGKEASEPTKDKFNAHPGLRSMPTNLVLYIPNAGIEKNSKSSSKGAYSESKSSDRCCKEEEQNSLEKNICLDEAQGGLCYHLRNRELGKERSLCDQKKDSCDRRVAAEKRKVAKHVSLSIINHLLTEFLKKKWQEAPFRTTAELSSYVRGIFKSHFITYVHGIEIERRDIRLLKPDRWLNDKILNIYFEMLGDYSKNIGKKTYVLSTYFYTALKKGYRFVQKWVEDINLFEYDLVFIPVHLTNHWIFICFDVCHKKLEYFDSLRGYRGYIAYEVVFFFLREHFRYYKTEFQVKIDAVKEISLQTNGVDCGVFTCMYAKRKLEGGRYIFKKDYMLLCRALMIHEIYIGRIIYDSETLLDYY